MGYNCYLSEEKIFIKTENFGGALAALIAEAEEHTVTTNFGAHQDGQAHMPAGVSFEMAKEIAAHGSVGEQQDLLFKFCREEGYSLGYDSKGNVCSINQTKEKWYDDTFFFDVFAKYVEKGSYIEMSGEDGEMWRMFFDGENCVEIEPKIEWPEMDNMIKTIDVHVIDEIKSSEECKIFDDINEFFAYMFNEEWSFKELVHKLTPQMKEDLIFNETWNGGVVKCDGKYYFSPDLKENFRATEPLANNKYAIAKAVEFEDFKNALECLDYSPDNFSEKELQDMFETLYNKLANDDVYSAIYNETLDEVVKEHEKVRSVSNLIVDATNKCEEVNNDGFSKDSIEFDKE